MILDISHHHTVKNWTKFLSQSDFCITKATEGCTYVDPTLKTFVKKCEEAKKPYWLYTFLLKGNEKKQAEHLVKTCKEICGECFIGYVLDVESNNDPGNVLEALKYLKTQGKKIMFYCMYSQRDKYKTVLNALDENCAFWEARYGKNDGTYNPKYPAHTNADLHQYTSAYQYTYVSGGLDANRVTGNGKPLEWFMTPINNSCCWDCKCCKMRCGKNGN